MPTTFTPGGRPLGLNFQPPDHRDRLYAAPSGVLANLPNMFDLGNLCPAKPVQNQTGSCTGNGAQYLYDIIRAREGLPPLVGSRNQIYWCERDLESTTDQDAGATIRDQMKALNTWGICPESEWPYQASNMLTRPSAQAYSDALPHRLGEYAAAQQVATQIMGAIADRYPVTFGFEVFQEYETLRGAGVILPMPKTNERPLGGHNNVITAYDATRARYPDILFRADNWWNEPAHPWGDNGSCWMPASFITNASYCADFWVPKLTTDQPLPPQPPPPPPEPWPFHVGDDVAAAIRAENDQPATNEDYPRRVDGTGSGYSVTLGVSGKRYEYVASTKTVRVFTPSKVY